MITPDTPVIRGVCIGSFTSPEIEALVRDSNTDRRRSEQPAVTRSFSHQGPKPLHGRPR
jgi:hypothetical protein